MEYTGSYNLAWWHSTSFWTILVDAHTGTHVHKDGGWEAGEQGEFVYYKWLWLQASCLHVLLYETCHLYHPEHRTKSCSGFEVQRFGFFQDLGKVIFAIVLTFCALIPHIHNSSVSCFLFPILTTKLPSLNVATAITNLSIPKGTWVLR